MEKEALKILINRNPWIKIAIILLIVIIIILIVYVAVKKIEQIKQNLEQGKTSSAAGDEIKKLQKSGETLSAREIDYQQTVSGIVTDLNGCEDLNTELKVIDDITKVVKKPIDWYYLVKLFDVKQIEDCGSFGNTTTTYALPELLKDQLDTAGVYAGIGGGIGSGFTSSSINLLEGYLSKMGVII